MRNSKYFIIFNGIADKDIGLSAIKRPNIINPQNNSILEKAIEGRDETVTVKSKTLKNIEIPVSYNFINREDFIKKTRLIKKWINKIGDNKLMFSDDPDMYYKVKYCKLQTIERTRKKKGSFEITFVCSPFIYYKAGDNEIINPNVLYNPSYLISKPIYKIEAEGIISLIVNGKETRFNIGQELLIDTELELCFRGKTKNNIAFEEGWFNDLFLKEDENTIEWKGNLKSLIVIPRWRIY
jgi:predicted phage tail component-like protein